MHNGRLIEDCVDRGLQEQRAGLTGRTNDSVYIALHAPTGMEVEQYPTVEMYLADAGFWEAQFDLHIDCQACAHARRRSSLNPQP